MRQNHKSLVTLYRHNLKTSFVYITVKISVVPKKSSLVQLHFIKVDPIKAQCNIFNKDVAAKDGKTNLIWSKS